MFLRTALSPIVLTLIAGATGAGEGADVPSPKMLYIITAVAVAALVVWVAFVLRVFKEPWARAPLAPLASLEGVGQPGVVVSAESPEEPDADASEAAAKAASAVSEATTEAAEAKKPDEAN
jgi:hypothetical protein